jgi:hypothetical protein
MHGVSRAGRRIPRGWITASSLFPARGGTRNGTPIFRPDRDTHFSAARNGGGAKRDTHFSASQIRRSMELAAQRIRPTQHI